LNGLFFGDQVTYSQVVVGNRRVCHGEPFDKELTMSFAITRTLRGISPQPFTPATPLWRSRRVCQLSSQLAGRIPQPIQQRREFCPYTFGAAFVLIGVDHKSTRIPGYLIMVASALLNC